MRFAISAIAANEKEGTIHGAGVVEAVNEKDAIGQAYLIALKMFPAKQGYFNHHVAVCDCNQVTNPETCNIQKTF